MNLFAYLLLTHLISTSPSAFAQLRGATPQPVQALIRETTVNATRALATTQKKCPSTFSANYQQQQSDGLVIHCIKDSDCAGWVQDGPGCCLYPYCLCGPKTAGVGSPSISCLNDAGTRAETDSPAATRPAIVITTPAPHATARPIPKPPSSTVRVTSKPVPVTPRPVPVTPKPSRLPTHKPTVKTTKSPTKIQKTCPSTVSAYYQTQRSDGLIIPCTKNSDCAGWTQDGSGCCLHPYCLCGAKTAASGSAAVTCLSL